MCVVNMCLCMHAVCYVCYLCCVSVRARVVCKCACTVHTVYGKTLEWEKFHIFCSFSVDHESFPLGSLAVYST